VKWFPFYVLCAGSHRAQHREDYILAPSAHTAPRLWLLTRPNSCAKDYNQSTALLHSSGSPCPLSQLSYITVDHRRPRSTSHEDRILAAVCGLAWLFSTQQAQAPVILLPSTRMCSYQNRYKTPDTVWMADDMQVEPEFDGTLKCCAVMQTRHRDENDPGRARPSNTEKNREVSSRIEKCRENPRIYSKQWFSDKPRFYRYRNTLPAPQMTAMRKAQKKIYFCACQRDVRCCGPSASLRDGAVVQNRVLPP
jgi:hypothetical protein